MKTFFGLVIGFLMICVSELSQASLIQWSVTDGGNDHWYDIVNTPQGINFNDAVTGSENKGGYLATPDMPGESIFIFNNLVSPTANGNYQYYWLGVFSLGAASGYQWEWVTGGTVASWPDFAYIDWAFANGGPQGIAQIPNNWWTAGYALQDQIQNFLANGYVVEYANPVPIPSAMILFGTSLIGFLGAQFNRKR